MDFFEITPQNLTKLYEAIISQNETYAPVEKFGNFDYKKISSLAACNPVSPIKNTTSIKPLFFPQTSEIMRYKETSEGIEVLPAKEDILARKKVILGVKHCDANALQVLDKVMNWDYKDDDYNKRRENSIIFGVLCRKAENTCFCTSLDYPLEESNAYDVLLIETDNSKFLKVCTEKGKAFLENYKDLLQEGKEKMQEEISAEYASFKNSFTAKMNYAEVNENMSKAFDSEQFNEVSKHCVSCNSCAFVCPTCHCFKVNDEKQADCGIRYKCYDSCNNKYFTLMAGGHNPRPVKYRRWRQRSMHKFVYYKERFGVNLCVGCGKCANYCPVNISIFEVANKVAYQTITN